MQAFREQGKEENILKEDKLLKGKELNVKEKEFVYRLAEFFRRDVDIKRFFTKEMQKIMKHLSPKEREKLMKIIDKIIKKAEGYETFTLLSLPKILKNKAIGFEDKMKLLNLVIEKVPEGSIFEATIDRISDRLFEDQTTEFHLTVVMNYLKKHKFEIKKFSAILNLISDIDDIAMLEKIDRVINSLNGRELEDALRFMRIGKDDKMLNRIPVELIISLSKEASRNKISTNAFIVFSHGFSENLCMNLKNMKKEDIKKFSKAIIQIAKKDRNLAFSLISSPGISLTLIESVIKDYNFHIRRGVDEKEYTILAKYILSKSSISEKNYEKEMDKAIKRLEEAKKTGKRINYREIAFGKKEENFKKRFFEDLDSYYSKAEGIERREINARISYIKRALRVMKKETLDRIKAKIKIDPELERVMTPEEIEDLKDCAARAEFYAYWIKYGEKANEKEFPKVEISFLGYTTTVGSVYRLTPHTIYISVNSDNLDKILQKGRSKRGIAFLRRIFNTVLHEAIHSIGKDINDNAYNEFATAAMQLFYLPQNKEEEIGYATTRMRDLLAEYYDEKEINMYLKHEYLSYLLMQYISATSKRSYIINLFRIDPYLFESFDMHMIISELTKLPKEKWEGIEKFSEEASRVDSPYELVGIANQLKENGLIIPAGLVDRFTTFSAILWRTGALNQTRTKELFQAFLKDMENLKNLKGKSKKEVRKKLLENTMKVLEKYFKIRVENLPLENYVYIYKPENEKIT